MVKYLAAKNKRGCGKQPTKMTNLTFTENPTYMSVHCVSSRAQGTLSLNSSRLTRPLPMTNALALTLLRPEKDISDSSDLL